MKLRADFVIEIEVADFVAAADHQLRLERLLDTVRAEYNDVRFSLNERRDRSGAGARSGPRLGSTGKLHEYEED